MADFSMSYGSKGQVRIDTGANDFFTLSKSDIIKEINGKPITDMCSFIYLYSTAKDMKSFIIKCANETGKIADITVNNQ